MFQEYIKLRYAACHWKVNSEQGIVIIIGLRIRHLKSLMNILLLKH